MYFKHFLFLFFSSLFAQNETWKNIGPLEHEYQNMGIIHTVDYEKGNLNHIIAGSGNGGLWETKNGGKTWGNISDSYTSATIGAPSVCFEPDNPSTIYLATGLRMYEDLYGVGLLKSKNGGQTWDKTGITFDIANPTHTHTVAVHPTKPSIVIATSDNLIFRSGNYGTTFDTTVTKKGLRYRYSKILFNPYNIKEVYICGRELWYSKNYGKTFINLTPFLPVGNDGTNFERITVAFTEKHTYAMYKHWDKNEKNFTYYISTTKRQDYKNWTIQSNPKNINTGYWYMEFYVNPNDVSQMYCGDQLMRYSSDSGKTFKPLHYYTPATTDIHVDIRDSKLVGWSKDGQSDTILIGNDGGVSISYNSGKKWQNLNGKGLSIAQFHGIGVAQSKKDIYIGGTQDNGYFSYRDGTWNNQILGDAYDCAFFPNSENEGMGLSFGGYPAIHKTIDTGKIWGGGIPTVNSAKYGARPFSIQPNGQVFIGYDNVFRWQIGAKEWQKISDFNNITNIKTITTHPKDSNFVILSFQNEYWDENPKEKLYVSHNALAEKPVWEDISKYAKTLNSDMLRWREISSVAIDSRDINHFWIALGTNYSNSEPNYKLFETKDGGKSWKNYAEGINEYRINKLYSIPSTDILLLGSDDGVYYRTPEMKAWERFGKNLPKCIVKDLDYNTITKKIVIGTYGRGIWELQTNF